MALVPVSQGYKSKIGSILYSSLKMYDFLQSRYTKEKLKKKFHGGLPFDVFEE
jgi:hypothetical protein